MPTWEEKVDEICDLICDPESQFYSLASWDESGQEAAYCHLNSPVAQAIADNLRGIEAIDNYTLRVPYSV